jgi:hypothetical protein
MSSDLDIYKNNKINSFKNIFNNDLARLKYTLETNIKIIQKSRQNFQMKQIQINKLINIYYNNLNSIKRILNNNITSLNQFTPPTIKINKNKNKKALLIGINYIGTNHELLGCINDVSTIRDRILKTGFNNNNITLLTDREINKPTKTNILKEFKNLLTDSEEGDLLFFAYSGHGSYTLDKNNDEMTGYDQMIVPCDFDAIIDDELKQIIQANLKPNVTLFAMFDSCFSGSVLDLKYQYMDSLNYDKFTQNDKTLETLGNVFMISGCSDYQQSEECIFNDIPLGAMTWSLLEVLKNKRNCTWRELVKIMRNILKKSKYQQIPQFSSGTFSNIDTEVFI